MRFNLLNLVAGPSRRPAQAVSQAAVLTRSRTFATTALRSDSAQPAASSSSAASSASAPASADAGAEAPFQISEEELRALESQFLSAQKPYFVERTDNEELPVYSKIRNGNQVKTIIRKVKVRRAAFYVVSSPEG